MIDARFDEQAALAALGWSDDPAGLDRASGRDPEVAQAVREYTDIAALLAYDAPQVKPPHELRENIFAALGPGLVTSSYRSSSTTPRAPSRFRFPRFALVPYSLAACLMGVALFLSALILLLDNRIDALRLRATTTPPRDSFNGVQLVDLAPQGDHGAAKCMVAWNSKTCCGMLSMADMPDAPAGYDYQLWVLDPSKPAPLNAGVVPRGARSHHFIAGNVTMPGRPGFAISMEPAGGRSTPTQQNILFAVAPSP